MPLIYLLFYDAVSLFIIRLFHSFATLGIYYSFTIFALISFTCFFRLSYLAYSPFPIGRKPPPLFDSSRE